MTQVSTYSEKKVRMNNIGRIYRDCKRRMDLCETEHTVQNNLRQYRNDASFVRRIDRTLNDCKEQTRFIIRNEYLTTNESDWYRAYYSPSSFYRRKKLAVLEFDRTLDY